MDSGLKGSKAECSQTTIVAGEAGYDSANSAPLPFNAPRGCTASPRRRGRKSLVVAGVLFPLPPLRLPLAEDAYAAAPACWWSRERWVVHNLALYDQHYTLLRRQNMVDSVSRKTFRDYLWAESAGADFDTGRNARITVRRLQTSTSRSESTMHRCRRLTNKLGTRTVVFTGRQRTKAERLESWRRDDRARGWAAVAALHETAVLPVDNQIVETLTEQGFGTPPEQSSGLSFVSREKVVSSTTNTMERRAPRGTDKKKRRRAAPAYDQRAVKLAASVLRDERFPLWVRSIRPGRATALLTRKAVAGWDVDDVAGALEEFRISGKALIDKPANPPGYLWSILDQIPDDVPPARLDRARTVATEEAERLTRQRQREQDRAAAMAAAGPDSPAYQAAMHTAARIGARTIGRARDRARSVDDARRELALNARRADPGA